MTKTTTTTANANFPTMQSLSVLLSTIGANAMAKVNANANENALACHAEMPIDVCRLDEIQNLEIEFANELTESEIDGNHFGAPTEYDLIDEMGLMQTHVSANH